MRPFNQGAPEGARAVEEELEMEEVELESPQLWFQTPPQPEPIGPGRIHQGLEMGAGLFSLVMSFLSPLRRLQERVRAFFRRNSPPPLGSCRSSSDCLHATSEYAGFARTLHGAPRVERLQTELFLMESLSTGRRRSLPETWSPRSPHVMTIQYGNRLGLLHLSSRPICSCRGSGTP